MTQHSLEYLKCRMCLQLDATDCPYTQDGIRTLYGFKLREQAAKIEAERRLNDTELEIAKEAGYWPVRIYRNTGK